MDRAIAHDLEGGRQRTSDVEAGQVTRFQQLRLKFDVKRGLYENNFKTPTRIQAAAIPLALEGLDLVIQSKSGTGKTLIYVVTIMNMYQSSQRHPFAIVVVPTRELAIQVEDVFFYLSKYLPGLKPHAFIGGTDVLKDRKRMADCRVIIGTPGRLLHLLHNQVFDVSRVSVLVLDEADQLFANKGMQSAVNELIEKMNKKRQIIASSATYENGLDEQLAKMMKSPLFLSNRERTAVLLGIRQFVYVLPAQVNSLEEMRSKLEALQKIFQQLTYEQALLFASSKMRADSYRNYLAASGVNCRLMSGGLEMSERLDVFAGFQNLTVRTIVTTDVMARGVDSPHTNLVVNLDPPTDHVNYLHRIGRAGRFGSHGIAITFVTAKDSERFRKILGRCHTGMSVLEFPQQKQQGQDFWDFNKYDFPYFLHSGESNPLKEMPERASRARNDEEKENRVPAALPANMEALVGAQLPEGNPSDRLEPALPAANLSCDGSTANEIMPEVALKTSSENENDFVILDKPRAEMPAVTVSQDQVPENAPEELENKVSLILETLSNEDIVNVANEIIELPTENVPMTESPGVSMVTIIKEEKPIQELNIESPNPEEVYSPELTPSLTPLELSQEPSPTTVTPPAPPANSINTKTYCLAPVQITSSTTLQPMVMSNTVDDASSIASDSLAGCSISSDFESFYSASDMQVIWDHAKTKKRNQKLFERRRKAVHKWVKKYQIKFRPRNIAPVKSFTRFYPPNYENIIKKFENHESLRRRLGEYVRRHNMSEYDVATLIDIIFDSIIELYYSDGANLESQREDALRAFGVGRQDQTEPQPEPGPGPEPANEPPIRLCIQVTHNMDIPPVAVAPRAEVPAVEADAQEDESSSTNTDGDEYSDEYRSSSGFVESNDSGSSGIDTSVYDTNTSTADEPDYDEEEDSSTESTTDSSTTSSDLQDDETDESEHEILARLFNSRTVVTSSEGSLEEDPDDEDDEDEEEDNTSINGDNNLGPPVQGNTMQQAFNMQHQFIAAVVADYMARSHPPNI